MGSEMHGPIYNPQEDNELDREVCRQGHFSILYISRQRTDLAYSKGVIAEWTHTKMRKIVWMNEPRHEDFACAGLAVSFLFLSSFPQGPFPLYVLPQLSMVWKSRVLLRSGLHYSTATKRVSISNSRPRQSWFLSPRAGSGV